MFAACGLPLSKLAALAAVVNEAILEHLKKEGYVSVTESTLCVHTAECLLHIVWLVVYLAKP